MHPAIINASQLILLGDIVGAEKTLVEIADQQGDTALVQILEDVAPKDLLAIMREYDGAKDSVLNLLVTPEQFARAVVLNKLYGERNNDKLRGMMNGVIYKNADTAVDYFAEIYAQDGGVATLGDYFAGHFEEVCNFAMHASFDTTPLPFLADDGSSDAAEVREFFEVFYSLEHILDKVKWSYTRAEVADGDWKESIWLLFHELPDAFDHLIGEIQARLLTAQRQSKPREIDPAALENLLLAIGGSDTEESAI